MSEKNKRVTVYFDPDLHKALRLKAAEIDEPLSSLVNEAVQAYLIDDAEDFAAIEARKNEPTIAYADFLKELKADGEL